MHRKFRAIVIDDFPLGRELLRDILEERGYQVFSYSDVTTCALVSLCRDRCHKDVPCADFLLTDNRMPHMHGIDFLELQEQACCQIPKERKALISGDWNQESLDRAEQLGFKTFHKPLELEELYSWLDEQEKRIPQDRILAQDDDIMA